MRIEDELITKKEAVAIGAGLMINMPKYQQYNQAIKNYGAKILKLPPEKQVDMSDLVDKFEELDWYHIGPTGELVHGANSEEDDALYRAEDVYKLLNDLKAYSDYTKWTPCCEAKPTNTGLYLVTERRGEVAQQYYIAEDKRWAIETLPAIRDRSDQLPVAWMELPKPWEGAQND